MVLPRVCLYPMMWHYYDFSNFLFLFCTSKPRFDLLEIGIQEGNTLIQFYRVYFAN